MDADRRGRPRYPFIADAEVTDLSSQTKQRARTSDLGDGGCFLDMLNPIPAGTSVHLRVFHESGGQKGAFEAEGRVAFVVANMGMGVAFTRVEEGQRKMLETWLAECRG